MAASKLSRIAYMFPSEPPGAVEFFEQLVAFVGRDPCSVVYEDLILLTPETPQEALPETSLELAEIEIPKIVLDTDLPFDVRIGNFYIHGSEVAAETPPVPFEHPHEERARLPLSDLVERFAASAIRVDHTGLNVPQSLFEDEQWEALLGDLSAVADLYAYPTGEPWYFVLPATPAESGGGITEFTSGRAPKFELVYDVHSSLPTVQFQIDTDLSRAEVEALLPEPYGIALEGFEDVFRTVFIEHPWPDLHIRFDMVFAHERATDPWSTAEWLVKQGRRLVYARS